MVHIENDCIFFSETPGPTYSNPVSYHLGAILFLAHPGTSDNVEVFLIVTVDGEDATGMQ